MQAQSSIISRIGARLLTDLPAAPEKPVPDWQPPEPFDRPPVPAAVMIPIVERERGYSVLYTERSPDLRSHSGQIAFPGGKIDPEDADAVEAAFREAAEEVALVPRDGEVLGFLPQYYTGTNYLITPVVALVKPQAPFLPNPREVAGLFEVPLDQLMRPETYGTYHIEVRGRGRHSTWQVHHEDKVIWGITANLTRRFYETALKDAE